MVERQTEQKLHILRSDNRDEYTFNELSYLLKVHGILHQRTAPYNPHPSKVFERLNRTVSDHIRSMLRHKNLSSMFWANALIVAAYIGNRVTSRGINSLTTPYELMLDKSSILVTSAFFGCRCWYTKCSSSHSKLNDRASEAILIG